MASKTCFITIAIKWVKWTLLCNDNLNIKTSIKYLPIYMLMLIYREKPANVKFSLDLSGLS